MRKFLRDRSKIISISNILIDRMFEKKKKKSKDNNYIGTIVAFRNRGTNVTIIKLETTTFP